MAHTCRTVLVLAARGTAANTSTDVLLQSTPVLVLAAVPLNGSAQSSAPAVHQPELTVPVGLRKMPLAALPHAPGGRMQALMTAGLAQQCRPAPARCMEPTSGVPSATPAPAQRPHCAAGDPVCMM